MLRLHTRPIAPKEAWVLQMLLMVLLVLMEPILDHTGNHRHTRIGLLDTDTTTILHRHHLMPFLPTATRQAIPTA